MITKERTEALASHSHVNQGHWGKNIQTKNSNNSIPPPNKNICYAGLSVITEGRVNSWKPVGPYQFSWTELCLLAGLRSYFLQAVFMGGFCRESKKKIQKKHILPPPKKLGSVLSVSSPTVCPPQTSSRGGLTAWLSIS